MYTGEANLSSLLFMNVYYISSLLFDCLHPFVDELTKRGRRIYRVYICMFKYLYLCIYVLFSLCISL